MYIPLKCILTDKLQIFLYKLSDCCWYQVQEKVAATEAAPVEAQPEEPEPVQEQVEDIPMEPVAIEASIGVEVEALPSPTEVPAEAPTENVNTDLTSEEEDKTEEELVAPPQQAFAPSAQDYASDTTEEDGEIVEGMDELIEPLSDRKTDLDTEEDIASSSNNTYTDTNFNMDDNQGVTGVPSSDLLGLDMSAAPPVASNGDAAGDSLNGLSPSSQQDVEMTEDVPAEQR